MGTDQSDTDRAPVWIDAEADNLAATHMVAVGPGNIVLLGLPLGGVMMLWRDALDPYIGNIPADTRREHATAFLAALSARGHVDLPAATLYPNVGTARLVDGNWVCVDTNGNETYVCRKSGAFVLHLQDVELSARVYSTNAPADAWLAFLGSIDEAAQVYPVENDPTGFLFVCDNGAARDVMLVGRRRDGCIVMGVRLSLSADGSALSFAPLGHDYQNRYYVHDRSGADEQVCVLRVPRH